MTTGNRLGPLKTSKKKLLVRAVLGFVLSSTLWASMGSVVGWQIGHKAGFKQGVLSTMDFVLELKEEGSRIESGGKLNVSRNP